MGRRSNEVGEQDRRLSGVDEKTTHRSVKLPRREYKVLSMWRTTGSVFGYKGSSTLLLTSHPA